MTVSDSQKVDLLYKKIFGVAKTDLPGNKSPSNESVASPSLNRGDKTWVLASSIPATAAAVSSIVQSYNATSKIQCTADTTSTAISSVYPTWNTGLTNWIPPEFGATYFIKVYVGASGLSDPSASGGTQIFDTGSGGTGEWNFDYQSGVLNFIGGTIPAALTSSLVVYIMGYRYIGTVGLDSLVYANANVATYLPTHTGNIKAGAALISNFAINSNSITVTNTDGNINLAPIGNGTININTTTAMLLPSGNNLARPATPTKGMIRFNSSNGLLEFYDGTTWIQLGSTSSTVVVSDRFTGTGSQTNFTLTQNTTTSGTLVTVNGVAQSPDLVYTVSGNVLTFIDPPLTTDIIDARALITTTSTTSMLAGNSSIIFDSAVNKNAILATSGGNLALNIGLANTTVYNNLVTTNGIFWPNGAVYGVSSLATYNGPGAFTSVTASANLTVGTIQLWAGNSQITGAVVSGVSAGATGPLNGSLGGIIPNTVVATSVTTTSGGQIIGYHTGPIGANTANTGVFTTLTATSGYQGNTNGDHNGTVGATTPNTGAFTTVTATGNITSNSTVIANSALMAQIGLNPVAGITDTSISAYSNTNASVTLIGDGAVSLQYSAWAYDTAGTGLDGTLKFVKYRGSKATPAALQTNDRAGLLYFQGADGLIIPRTLTSIGSYVESIDNSVINKIGGYLVFNTRPGDSATNATERMRITGNGFVGIGTQTPASALHVVGNITGYFNGPIGANTANTGAFTTVTATSNISTTAQFVSTVAGSASTNGGQIVLGGATSNRIDFAGVGLGDPSTSSRSAGTKIVLWPQIDGSGVDYAIGLTSGVLWNSVHDETKSFKWFANASPVATLTGGGNLTVTNQVIGYFNGAIGANTANSGAFTTVTTTGNLTTTISGFTGRIGINTTTPKGYLHVNGNTNVAPSIYVTNQDTTGTGKSWLYFEKTDTTVRAGDTQGGIAWLRTLSDGSIAQSAITVNGSSNISNPYNNLTLQANADITFSTFAYNGGASQELMRIRGATGLVGIGTINPSANLHVIGNVVGYFEGPIGANTANTGVFTSVSTTSGGQITGYLTGPIGANTANTGAFTSITASGDVVVTGNLTVNGTTTTVNSTVVSINDLNIILANNAATSSAADGAGLTVNGASATILYKHATTSWDFNKTANFIGTVNAATIQASTIGNSGATLYGTLNSSSASQTNITSVGTLTGLTVSGNTFLTTSTGSVGIGTSSPIAQLHLNSTGYSAIYLGNNNSNGFHITKETTDNSFNIWSGTFGSGTNRFKIDSTGNSAFAGNVQIASLGIGTAASGTSGEIRATNNVTAYYSDDRLKTRLGNIDNALEKLISLNGFNYQPNDIAQALGYEIKDEVGVSAQEVQKVLPSAVVPAPIDDKYLTVHYDRLIPLLIEAIKELTAKVERLEGK